MVGGMAWSSPHAAAVGVLLCACQLGTALARTRIKTPVVWGASDYALATAKCLLAFSPIIALVYYFGVAHKNDKRLKAKKKHDSIGDFGNDDRNAAPDAPPEFIRDADDI